MKKGLTNILIVFSIIFLCFIYIYNFNKFTSNQRKLEMMKENGIQFCLENDYIGSEYENYCKEILMEEEHKIDFFTIFSDTFVLTFNQYTYFSFFLITIPTLIFICRYFKNKIIINDLSRQSFKKIKNKLFKNAYKTIIILPTILLIAILSCYMYTKTFDATYSITNGTTIWNEYTLTHPYIFLILYFLNIIIHSLIYINIALCIARKQHNFFPALILSFLCFIGIESILEILFGGIICTSLLNVNYGILFNIMNLFSFNDIYGILSPLIIPIIVAIITFVVLYIMYKDKEQLIIDIEKNEQKE